MEIVPVIRKKLSAIGENFDALKPFMQTWLVKIETAIQSRKQEQTDAVKQLKAVDYSVKSIADEVHASRTTMYNHEQLLKRYIEYSAGAEAADSPLNEISRLHTEKQNLQDQVSKLMLRDVETELMKMQIRTLSATLEGKNAEIARQKKRVAELSEENQELKRSGRKPAARPATFRKK